VLDEILVHKRAEVAGRKAQVSAESLLARCSRTERSLRAALQAGKPGFLLEIKTASPSEGVLRADSDVEAVVESYARHADAVSVLTDQRFFGGSLERLAVVRHRLPQPLLCKDFILEPYQVVEARAHGADAILLILAAVPDATWRECAAAADRLGMEVLTEVHDLAEAHRAIALGAHLIGINNRNLRTLEVSPGTVAQIAPLIPAGCPVVAESGIRSRDQVRALSGMADAFLIGTALMREADVDAAVRRLVYGRTKVCGLTRAEDARAALRAGATHGGLIFVPASPRCLGRDQAAAVRAGAGLEWVGVFEDQDAARVAETASGLGLDAVQLHGAEGPEAVAALRRLLPETCQIWKAVPASRQLPLRADTGADRILLDAHHGGSGAPFDWTLLDDYAELNEAVLAGGLGPMNVTRAAALGTYALDASSRLESAPGRKDPARLASFFSARRRLPGRGTVAA